MEHIPAYILDWIAQTPFDELSAKQQQEVKAHLSAEEYNQLHQAANIASAYATNNKDEIVANPTTLQHLNTAFDAAYSKEKASLTPLLYWKIAASFLLLATAVLSFGWYKAQHQNPQVVTQIKTDTIFVERATTQPQNTIIYDTIYVEQNVGTGKKMPKRRSRQYSVSPFDYKELPPLENPLNSIPFSDKDLPQNNPKNNSIKDDTLIQNFDFVQL